MQCLLPRVQHPKYPLVIRGGGGIGDVARGSGGDGGLHKEKPFWSGAVTLRAAEDSGSRIFIYLFVIFFNVCRRWFVSGNPEA